MKAMILAAGLGTRLRPLTDTKPKALIEYRGAPLLEHVLNRLVSLGVNEVIINLHHLPEQIVEFVKSKNHFGIRIESSLEPKLLDTGGGLKQAAWFFDDDQPFILHNVDVISDIDLNNLMAAHRAGNHLATLAVNQRETSRYFLFDENENLCGWQSLKDNRVISVRQTATQHSLAFCGIHVISPRIFSKLTEAGAFSIVESYLRLAAEGERIRAFRVDHNRWLDVGKLSVLQNSAGPQSTS
jgi:NDP-sugar pyrophosphorylase family protein